jgi:hypothetical protein
MGRINNRQSVLDSVNGNSDRAIDALLGMSDPDFQSDQPQQPQQQVPQVSLVLYPFVSMINR